MTMYFLGDIILSINGRSIAGLKHNDIVQLINSTSSLRLVVLFADCAHKVELCSRALKLKVRKKELQFVHSDQYKRKLLFAASEASG